MKCATTRAVLVVAWMCSLCAGAAPSTQHAARAPREPEPAPTIEYTGPLRVARYTRPFANAPATSAWSRYEDRYYYATPAYGCYGWYGGYSGYGTCGWRYYGFGCWSGSYSNWPTTGVAPSGAYSPGW